MDDFNISSLNQSRNEWSSRLITILTPLIIEGLRAIFDEALALCKSNNEMDKYLMTFQNFITRIPKWNPVIVEKERQRIIERSGCAYLEDLITCVHIIQLKLLTAMRVGQKQKKIDISIPKLDDFIHNVYIHVARKIYTNVYLFEINIPPLQVQRQYRETELIVQECILNTIRESIPVETILLAYMDETVEEDVVEEIKEELIEMKKEPVTQMIGETHAKVDAVVVEQEQEKDNSNAFSPEPVSEPSFTQKDDISFPELSFSDVDFVQGDNNTVISVDAPKTIERLEHISTMRNEERKREAEEDDDEEKLKIFDDEPISLDVLDIHDLNAEVLSF
jgi:hypothetical protein